MSNYPKDILKQCPKSKYRAFDRFLQDYVFTWAHTERQAEFQLRNVVKQKIGRFDLIKVELVPERIK